MKTLSENRFSWRTYYYTIASREEERAREAARGEGPPKAKDEEEEEEEEEGGSGKSTDSGYRSKRDEVKMVGKLKVSSVCSHFLHFTFRHK